MERSWLAHAGGGQPLAGDELVVHAEQRLGRVEDANAATGEGDHVVETRLDTVERAEHVQADERDVAGPEGLQRLAR